MPTLSRRNFLAQASVAGAAATLPGAQILAKAPDRKLAKIGIQAFTLGGMVEEDFPDACKKIASIGYKLLEFGIVPLAEARAHRAALDAAGLACHSQMIPGQSLGGPSFDGNLDDIAASAKIMGARYISMPIMLIPKRFGPINLKVDHLGLVAQYVNANRAMTVEDWRDTARFLEERGAKLKKSGLKVAYHNHNFEFKDLGGITAMDIMARETDPDHVCFEMDAGWVVAAGLDPVDILKRYPGRFRLMHVKDVKPSTRANYDMLQDPTEIGSGMIDWKRILPAAIAAGVEDFYVEQEAPFSMPRIDAARVSYDYLAKLRF